MTLFPEWQEQHKDEAPLLPKRIKAMWDMYGRTEGKTCKKCKFLAHYHQGASWMKCTKSRVTSSVATDWRAGWPACGLWEEEK